MNPLVKLLTKHNLTLATCESLTGGEFAATLTAIPGTSLILKGGLVVYTNEAKIKLALSRPRDACVQLEASRLHLNRTGVCDTR